MAVEDSGTSDIPAIKFSEKKIDDSWKEEVRREREAAAARAAEKQKAAAAPPAPAPGESVAPAGTATFDPPAADAGDPAAASAPGTPGAPAAQAVPGGKPASAIEQQQTKIFLNFLEGLAQQALMQLGEMENPYSGQQEVDIQGARYTLELLATIQNKTKGNLNEAESKALAGLLQDLRATYSVIAQELQRQMAAQLTKTLPKK